MGRIITLSMAVLMAIGGMGVVLSETVKQTAWGGPTKAAIMHVPGGETTATDPSVTGFAPLSGPTMGNLMPGFDLLSDTMMGDPNNPCLLYTSDAADDLTRVDLGGRRIIK